MPFIIPRFSLIIRFLFFLTIFSLLNLHFTNLSLTRDASYVFPETYNLSTLTRLILSISLSLFYIFFLFLHIFLVFHNPLRFISCFLLPFSVPNTYSPISVAHLPSPGPANSFNSFISLRFLLSCILSLLSCLSIPFCVLCLSSHSLSLPLSPLHSFSFLG